MSLKALRRGLMAAAALGLGLALSASAFAQGMFYREIEKDGRIYVFSTGKKAEMFEKSGEMGVSITRPGAGPNGETLVFENEDAINLYHFRHNEPGENFTKPAEPAKSPYPAGKFSGLMFGDYYYWDKWHQSQISDTNKSYVQGQTGFWFRRIYFTYDLQFSEKFTTRFRLEANSNGQFVSPTTNINPYIKDAYLKWTFTGKQVLTLGIQPSLTFDWFENWYGLRHIEKTPADLYRIDSSRDFGLTVGGPIEGVKNLFYAAQFGNESGTGSEVDKYKIFRLEARYDMNPGIALEGFYSFGNRPSGQDRTTAQGILGYRNKAVRVAGQYLYQERKSGTSAPDQKIDIWSVFGYWEFSPKKADIFGRFDSVKGTLAGKDTGLPGADGIDYWILSTKQPFKTYIFGLEYYLHPSIRISPNVEWVKYDDDPDPTNFPGRDTDRVYRLTFFWTF